MSEADTTPITNVINFLDRAMITSTKDLEVQLEGMGSVHVMEETITDFGAIENGDNSN